MWKLFLKKFRFYGYYFRWHEAVKFRHPILCAYKVGTNLKKMVLWKTIFESSNSAGLIYRLIHRSIGAVRVKPVINLVAHQDWTEMDWAEGQLFVRTIESAKLFKLGLEISPHIFVTGLILIRFLNTSRNNFKPDSRATRMPRTESFYWTKSFQIALPCR